MDVGRWFELPGELVPKGFQGLPGENDCRTNLSPIFAREVDFLVPNEVWEDCLVDSDAEELAMDQSSSWVVFPMEAWKLVRADRKKAYRACRWFPELVSRGVPTCPGILLEPKDWSQTREMLSNRLTSYPFIRTCRASPKDVATSRTFSVADDAMDALRRSSRTKLFSGKSCVDGLDQGCHLFLRAARRYVVECCCFWTRDKLRAVSFSDSTDSLHLRTQVVDFFRRHGPDLPYHSAVVDLGWFVDTVDDRQTLEVIEINQFGPDLNAGAGRFSWIEDAAVLSSSETPVFRPTPNDSQEDRLCD